MSSSNQCDIQALLAQLQQQQQQNGHYVASNTLAPGFMAFQKKVQGSAVPSSFFASSPSATSALLSNCLEAMKSNNTSSGAQSTQAVLRAISNPGNPMDHQLLQKLLTLAKLLSSINPPLATAAIEHALALLLVLGVISMLIRHRPTKIRL